MIHQAALQFASLSLHSAQVREDYNKIMWSIIRARPDLLEFHEAQQSWSAAREMSMVSEGVSIPNLLVVFTLNPDRFEAVEATNIQAASSLCFLLVDRV